MVRPDTLRTYDELDLKLGIKSSLPHVKATIALSLLMWEASGRKAVLHYTKADGDKIVIEETLFEQIKGLIQENVPEVTDAVLLQRINENQLLKSQLEALIVAFELIWKLAKVRFEDNLPSSAERTGGTRFPKVISYTINADIIHCVVRDNLSGYCKVLLNWMGLSVAFDANLENNLVQLLTVLSENAIFKLSDGNSDVVFNQYCLYSKALSSESPVDINGDKEAKGSLRILKSLLGDNLQYFLNVSGGAVSIVPEKAEEAAEYQQRVETYLRLSATKVVGLPEDDDSDESEEEQENQEPETVPEVARKANGENTLLYGVPGVGKSYTIQTEYCDDEHYIERLVFHPDYTYSDFVGQILPTSEDGKVRYEFIPGPFTRLLKRAQDDPGHEYYLIIEEINRGNAPAIFGDVFQLLDRTEKDVAGVGPKGTSQYGITNADVAKIVYGDPVRFVRIPSNMSILATMNTADQNVFTLDTAFQRRWHMRMVENSFEEHPFADNQILDTGISWKNFCLAINHEILLKSAGMTSSEDKRLGAYFVCADDLIWDDREADQQMSSEIRRAAKRHNSLFAEKVIKYLWDDAFKYYRGDIFEISNYNSLEAIIKQFMQKTGADRLLIFKEEIRNRINNPGQ